MGERGSYLYITYLRATNPEVFYVEGSFNQAFKDCCLKPRKACWDPNNKRWVLQKEHLAAVRQESKGAFDTVYYGEGGDYITL